MNNHLKIVLKKYRTKAREVKFNGFWDNNNQSLNKIKKGIPFSGKIDLVNSDNRSYMVVDYKGTHYTGSIANEWVRKKVFQMAIYIQALEQGLVENLPPLTVQIALFLSYKDFTYKGLAFENDCWSAPKEPFRGLSNKSRSIVPKDEKSIYFKTS